jgi:hypothetical protein
VYECTSGRKAHSKENINDRSKTKTTVGNYEETERSNDPQKSNSPHKPCTFCTGVSVREKNELFHQTKLLCVFLSEASI